MKWLEDCKNFTCGYGPFFIKKKQLKLKKIEKKFEKKYEKKKMK